MVRDNRWKLIWYPKINRYQLFDLANDPWEVHDLAEQPKHAKQLTELKMRLGQQQREFGDRHDPPIQ
jgi:arylsulfatase A-like enzyme